MVTRNETGTGTIPNFASFTGTFTDNAVNSAVLDYNGTLTPEDVFGARIDTDNGLYVYSPTNNEVRKVLGVNKGVDPDEWNVLLESAFTVALAGENVRIVTANLTDYSIANQGAADGEYNGVPFNVGAYYNDSDSVQRSATDSFCKAATFDATGTEFLIIEQP